MQQEEEACGRQAGTLCHKMRRQNVVKFLLWRLLIRAAAATQLATLAASAVKHAMQTRSLSPPRPISL